MTKNPNRGQTPPRSQTPPKAREAVAGPSARRVLPSWNVDSWVGVLSLVISLCAIVFTVLESRASRAHDKLSVLPRINLSFHSMPDSVGIIMSNVGLGPATVKTFHVLVEDRVVTNWRQALSRLGVPDVVPFHFRNVYPGQLVPVAETGGWLLVLKNEAPANQLLRGSLSRLNVQVCYCSLYGDCWRTSMDLAEYPAVPVEECGENGLLFNQTGEQ